MDIGHWLSFLNRLQPAYERILFCKLPCQLSAILSRMDRDALVQRNDGSIVTTAEALRSGDRLRIRLKDGTVPVTVEGDEV